LILPYYIKNMNDKDFYIFLGAFFAIVFLVAIAIAVPFSQIWAINTLFKTEIEYNPVNWFAMILLNSFFARISTYQKHQK